ncbi:hypothetical protein G7Z17_g5741 [Cylindrodendrum hubeiense]|uniref:Uncharacterized protein n=1 Tax=Cylindrodendrum hubeiense TaxID=595255 RepID=A0A9P5HDK3_9HYPO|nr:hypothetical protein G7Z17_g5741 [Cylindrodendrum hubeiense]
MAQASHPTFINLPPPSSRPDTPSEVPVLRITAELLPAPPLLSPPSPPLPSRTAIRGHFPPGSFSRGHQHNPSTTSLEAERADRISRLAGLERVSTLRAPPPGSAPGGASSISPQTTPTSTTGFPTNFPPNFPATQHLTPAYFDSNGQPVAVTKMSTRDEDMLSTGTNYREADSVASMGGYADDRMDEDLDGLATRSMGGYDDRMSDDGSASLVGFGEGAGSTVSGPIYHRRPAPGSATAQHIWGLERTNSGLSDARRERDIQMGGDMPVSASAMQERRDARMVDGVAADPHYQGHPYEHDSFVDTTFRGPVSATQSQSLPGGPQDTAERIIQRLDRGETRAESAGLVGPGRSGEPLGKFYFEGERRDN